LIVIKADEEKDPAKRKHQSVKVAIDNGEDDNREESIWSVLIGSDSFYFYLAAFATLASSVAGIYCASEVLLLILICIDIEKLINTNTVVVTIRQAGCWTY